MDETGFCTDGGVESRYAGSQMRLLRELVGLASQVRQPKTTSLGRAVAKWLFVFNSNFLLMKEDHRSAGKAT